MKASVLLPKALILFALPAPVGNAAAQPAQDAPALKRQAIREVDSLEDLVESLGKELWLYPETALQETRSSRLLAGALQRHGFSVERGVADLPTAFVASWGEGGPVIGILAEYDALPGVGNQALPEKLSRTDGVTSGHGCGHNLFGSASVGGAIALKTILERHRLPGTVKLFGTPAEETVVGKVYMARRGVFDALDAVIDWHPGTENEVRNQPGRAMNNFQIEFFGQAAHSSADPWNGRSALDAVELLNHGVNLMREHVLPTTRIHYVIPGAGEAPNVVPEYARVWYYVRAENRPQVDQYYDWILKIAEGAALATRTTHQVHLMTGVHEYLLNRPLQKAILENFELVGTPAFTEEEQEFARRLQRFLRLEETGFSTELKPLAPEPEPVSGGSTDAAEVSWIAPTAGFNVATAARGVPWHSWATTACHGTSAGRRAALVAARVIAATGVDLLTRPRLLLRAREFHEHATGGRPYRSTLPEGWKRPPFQR